MDKFNIILDKAHSIMRIVFMAFGLLVLLMHTVEYGQYEAGQDISLILLGLLLFSIGYKKY